jgi:uncharacterized protein (TIGR00369 family)
VNEVQRLPKRPAVLAMPGHGCPYDHGTGLQGKGVEAVPARIERLPMPVPERPVSWQYHGLLLPFDAGAAMSVPIDKLNAMLKPMLPGLLGMDIIEAGPDRIVGRMQVRPDMCTAGGILHGGASMAFADTLGAVATFVNMAAGSRTATIESKTNFIGAAAVGTTVTGTTRPFHKGKTTQVWQTEIMGEDGKLVAVVSQTQMVFPPKA